MAWLILFATVLGSILNANGNIEGFYFWVFTNSYWAIRNLKKGDFAQASLFAFFLLITVYGICAWRGTFE